MESVIVSFASRERLKLFVIDMKQMENIFWTGYSNGERHSTINNIKDIIAQYGDTVAFAFFSDMSITMTIEVEEHKIDTLYEALGKLLRLDAFEALNSLAKTERTVYLNVTFVQGTGKHVIKVPAVPG